MGFLKDTLVKKTRKPHTCFGCQMTIPIGSKAWVHDGVFDDKFHSDHFCITCKELLKIIPYEVFEDGIPPGILKQEYSEQWEEINQEQQREEQWLSSIYTPTPTSLMG